jgi:outer membrane protein
MKIIKLMSLMAILATANSYAADDNTSASDSKLVIGAGIAYGPEYVGAKNNKVMPVIYADYQAANGFFASSARGLGYQTSLGVFDGSAAFSYGGSRGDDIANITDTKSKFKGMGDVANSPLLLLDAGVSLWGKARLSAGAEIKLNHRENGHSYNLGLAVPLYTSATDQISVSGFAHYADAKYAQTYYGVTAVQSRNSGYAAYSPSAGFDTGSLTLTWNHQIDKKWGVSTAMGMKRLFKNAENSPLTESKNSMTAALIAGYSF